MPRAPRFQDAGYIHHVISRGNDRQILFKSINDYKVYLNLLNKARKQYPIKIYNFVLMHNHVHMLLEPKEDGNLSKVMEFVSKSYAKYFNKEYDHIGHVFQGRFKSFLIQKEKYFFACMRYIDLNPVKVNIVSDPNDYLWNGYRALANNHKTFIKIDYHELYNDLGNSAKERGISYKAIVMNSQQDDLNLLDRRAGVLGDADFKNKFKYK